VTVAQCRTKRASGPAGDPHIQKPRRPERDRSAARPPAGGREIPCSQRGRTL